MFKYFVNKISRNDRNLFKISLRNIYKYVQTQKINDKLNSNEIFNSNYYEEVISLLPKTNNGTIQFRKEIFKKGLEDAKTNQDIEYLLNVIADFIGNQCPLTCTNLDEYVAKSIELKCPNSIIPLLKNHRPLMYYPNPLLITKIFELFSQSNDFSSMKSFHSIICKKYYIQKEAKIYNIYFQMAYENKEYDEIINSFLDILDYETTILDSNSYNLALYCNNNLINDKIYFEIIQKAIFNSGNDGFSSLFAFFIYNHYNKEQKIIKDDILKLIENNKDKHSNKIIESEFVKSFLSEFINEGIDSKLKFFIIENKKYFDNCYNELLNKIV